jgi:hypothetical protein
VPIRGASRRTSARRRRHYRLTSRCARRQATTSRETRRRWTRLRAKVPATLHSARTHSGQFTPPLVPVSVPVSHRFFLGQVQGEAKGGLHNSSVLYGRDLGRQVLAVWQPTWKQAPSGAPRYFRLDVVRGNFGPMYAATLLMPPRAAPPHYPHARAPQPCFEPSARRPSLMIGGVCLLHAPRGARRRCGPRTGLHCYRHRHGVRCAQLPRGGEGRGGELSSLVGDRRPPHAEES